MESYPLPHLSTTVHLALFSPLANAAALRTRLVSASQLPANEEGERERRAVDFAFVDASRVRILSSLCYLLPLTFPNDRLLPDFMSSQRSLRRC
jgi:EKC/KEOPS complex subunit CGI121/TPRKB